MRLVELLSLWLTADSIIIIIIIDITALLLMAMH